MAGPAAEKVLLVAHSPWREGRLAPLLENKGYAVEWRCPAKGDELPADGEAYAGTVVLGGVQSANDAESEPYLRREIDWIERHVAAGRRFLGICLGGQLLARALGAKVAPHEAAVNEIGYYPVYPTEAGRVVIPDGLHVYHWHKEGFDLPPGATLLARGDAFPQQAYRYGSNVYGVQFHPEVTSAVAAAWIKGAPEHLLRPGAQAAEHQLAAAPKYDALLHGWLDGFLDHWLGRQPQISAAAK